VDSAGCPRGLRRSILDEKRLIEQGVDGIGDVRREEKQK
jgi:hypothetical protein